MDELPLLRVKPFFRMTFVPAGTKRKRTVLVRQLSEHSFKRVDKDGSDWRRSKMAMIDDVPTEVITEEMIITGSDRVLVPLGINLHYATLEEVKT